MKDYKLANIRKKELKLAEQREAILKLDPEEAVDSILSSPQPATLIQSFPEQDLYFLMQTAGPEDFIPVLSLSSSDQWEHIMDMDIWEDDRPDITHMTKVLSLLFKADPQRLMRWMVKEKVDMLEYFFLKNTEIWIREHDDVPPDEEGFITFDDKFYFRFPDELEDEERKPASELITNMLDTVAEMDISVFHALLLETNSVLSPEVEEEEFRLKNVRLAEKGFLPAYEAVGVYQPLSPAKFRKRPADSFGGSESMNSALPAVSVYASGFMKEDNLFAHTLEKLESDIVYGLQMEFTSLVNRVISADRIKIREKKDIQKVIEKACAYLSVGIERADKNNPASVLQKYMLEDVFRAGSGEILKLGRKINTWHPASFMNKNNLPLSFLDEKWLGIAGGLMLDRPLYFDNYNQGESYRDFKSLNEVESVASEIEKMIKTDEMLSALDIDIKSFSRGILTYKSLLLTLWTKNHLGMESSLAPIPVSDFKEFFSALFSDRQETKIDNIKREDFILWISKVSQKERNDLADDFVFAVHEMFDEIEEEYGAVDVDDIDLRLVRHFLLT